MTKVIAEIGINHQGSLIKALDLIKDAKKAGCWGVKFQFRPNEDFFSETDEMGSTLIKSELKKSNLQMGWVSDLIDTSRDLDIKLGMSFFRSQDLELFFDNNFVIDFIKIPSAEFRNIELINASKKYKLPIIISYGGGNEAEIIKAVKEAQLSAQDCVMHCISNYPISLGNQQLDFLKRLKKVTKATVGYSSHDKEWEVSLLSLQYGIDFIERHLCKTKSELGLDISTSSTMEEMKKLVEISKGYSSITKSKKRVANQGEILNVRNLGSGLFFKSDYLAGEEILIEDLIEKSPATGLRKSEIGFEKTILLKDARANEALQRSHFKKLKLVPKAMKRFRIDKRISLPVRLHDFESIRERFGGNYYELHLSYAEVKNLLSKPKLALDHIKEGDHISIHLPDYISQDHLIDPFSNNRKISVESQKLVDICLNLSKEISNISQRECIVLGSFSKRSKSKEEFFEELSNYFFMIKQRDNVSLLAQWLPKKAWYFGGSEILDTLCGPDDIDLVKKYNLPLCLDISHLILSANYFNQSWYDWYVELLPYCKHMHISDGEGIDGEGVDFGKGDISHYEELLNFDGIKVLEVWEGHHDVGEKFRKGLSFLMEKLS